MNFKPVMDRRVVCRGRRYSDVDWKDETQAIHALKAQLENWYVEPTSKLVEHPYAGFTVLALSCVLIDTLAQYESGSPSSKSALFKSWLIRNFPDSATAFPSPIFDPSAKGDTKGIIRCCADAIYHSYRCGILHEAHPPIYCGIAGEGRAIPEQDEVFSVHPKGLTQYSNGDPCPTVVVAPAKLFNEVCKLFERYFSQLLDPAPCWDHLRANFRRKFALSHGIQIGKDH